MVEKVVKNKLPVTFEIDMGAVYMSEVSAFSTSTRHMNTLLNYSITYKSKDS